MLTKLTFTAVLDSETIAEIIRERLKADGMVAPEETCGVVLFQDRTACVVVAHVNITREFKRAT